MELISQTLAAITVGSPVQFGGLEMAPLLRAGGVGQADYRTLDEALAAGEAQVVEVSEAGSVPELRFENKGGVGVLLIDGEELVGAKQNRVLNLTILVPAATTVTIPVTCVEAGRWHHTSREFRSESRAFYARGRARKAAQVSDSMSGSGTRRSDQHAVWGDIAGKAARLQSESASGAMAAMYERHRTRLEDYIQAFPVVDRQCGAVFSIRGAVTGIEMFDFPSIAGKLLPKLIQSYALDAIDEAEGAQARGLTIDGFLGLLSSTAMRSYPSVGEGDDLRYAAGAVAGGALAARGRVVHLSAFATQTAAALGEPRKAAGMASASVRRRNRSGRAGA